MSIVQLVVVDESYYQLLSIKIVSDSPLKPSDIYGLELPKNIYYQKGIVIEGEKPLWLYAHIITLLGDKPFWLAIKDTELSAVVVKSTCEIIDVGDIVRLN